MTESPQPTAGAPQEGLRGARDGVVMSARTSRRPIGARGGVKTLIAVAAMSATAFGWFLFSRPETEPAGGAARAGEGLPLALVDLMAPLPTLVPARGGSVRQAAGPQPVMRSVSLPASRPVTITVTRSSK